MGWGLGLTEGARAFEFRAYRVSLCVTSVARVPAVCCSFLLSLAVPEAYTNLGFRGLGFKGSGV